MTTVLDPRYRILLSDDQVVNADIETQVENLKLSESQSIQDIFEPTAGMSSDKEHLPSAKHQQWSAKCSYVICLWDDEKGSSSEAKVSTVAELQLDSYLQSTKSVMMCL